MSEDDKGVHTRLSVKVVTAEWAFAKQAVN